MTEYYEWFDVESGHNGLVNTGSTTATYAIGDYFVLDDFTSDITGWTSYAYSYLSVSHDASGSLKISGTGSSSTQASVGSSMFSIFAYKDISVNVKFTGTFGGGSACHAGFGLVKDRNNWICLCTDSEHNRSKIAKCVNGIVTWIGNVTFSELTSSYRTIKISISGNLITFTDKGISDTVTFPGDFDISEMKWGLGCAVYSGGYSATVNLQCDSFKGKNEFGYYSNGDVITNKIVDAGANIKRFMVVYAGDAPTNSYYSKNGTDWTEITSDRRYISNSTDPVDLYLKFSVGAGSKFKGFALSVD